MKYFISPDQEPIKKLSAVNLIKIIHDNFSNVKIETLNDSARAYSHQVSFVYEKEYIDILIPKNLDSLIIETNIIRDLSKFINEVRKEFSKDDNVLLYDESYSYVVPVSYDGIEASLL